MSFQSKKGTALRDLFESLGEQGANKALEEMILKEEISPMDLSFREVKEALSSDMFPTTTSTIINSTIVKEFNWTEGLIGGMITHTTLSKMEVDKIAGFEAPVKGSSLRLTYV